MKASHVIQETEAEFHRRIGAPDWPEVAETLAAAVHRQLSPYAAAHWAAIQLEMVMRDLNPAWVHYTQHGQILSDRAGEVGL